MIGWTGRAALALVCVAGLGCAGSQQRGAANSAQLEQADASQQPAQRTVAAQPRPEDVEPLGPPIVARPVEEASTPPAPAPVARPVRAGSDGRPEWWLREPQWTDGRLVVCAEALGEDVLDARRSAVASGHAALQRALSRDPGAVEIVATTVRPLPVPAQAPGGKRYVGYVMVSALTEPQGQ